MLVAFAVALACGGTEDPGDSASGDRDAAANATSWKGGARLTVGGTLSSLSGGAVTLQDNGNYDTLTLSANGTFTFSKPLKNRATYAVTVLTQPSGQTCTVANGTGTISGASVTDVAVSCSPNPVTNYTVGGTIPWLWGTVVLQNNGGDDVTVSATGSAWLRFTFPTALPDGARYAVTVLSQPSGLECVVTGGTNGDGTGTIAGANVTDVAVTCSPISYALYTVGGRVSGLSGPLVLQDNGGDDLTLTADGSFTFVTSLADGANYAVTVRSKPASQTCTVANGTGTIAGANVTNVEVSCAGTSTQVAMPTFSPAPNAYYLCHDWFVQSVSVAVTLSEATPGAAIYYTTDGTLPTSSSTPYAGSITVNGTTTIRAIAIASGVSSDVASGTYAIQQANTYGTTADPTLTPVTGAYTSPQIVTLSDPSPGATIYYAVVDDTATAVPMTVAAPFTVYTGPITVDRTSTVEAYASLSGGLCSPGLVAEWYTISQVAPPYLSPPSGPYGTCDGTLQVFIGEITPGAVIYYTTNGTTPTTASAQYTGSGITLSNVSDVTIKAIAVANGLSDSIVVGASYSVYSDVTQCSGGS